MIIPSIVLFLVALIDNVAASRGQPKPMDITVAALGPNRTIVVNLSYNISGVVSSPTPCRNSSVTECLPVLQSRKNRAESDSVIINWAYNASALPRVAQNVSGIELRGCFSPKSIQLRAWRQDRFAANPSVSKTCKFVITKAKLLNASEGNGTTTWKLPNNVPVSSLSIRAYTVCGVDADGNKVYCAWGQSPGFFAVQSWDSVPSWLVAVTVPMMCLGPAIFVAYCIVKLARKNK